MNSTDYVVRNWKHAFVVAVRTGIVMKCANVFVEVNEYKVKKGIVRSGSVVEVQTRKLRWAGRRKAGPDFANLHFEELGTTSHVAGLHCSISCSQTLSQQHSFELVRSSHLKSQTAIWTILSIHQLNILRTARWVYVCQRTRRVTRYHGMCVAVSK